MSDVLQGIRILDWTAWQHGPYTTLLLGAMGAEVIKIENPEGGDPARGIQSIVGAPAAIPGGGNYFIEANNMNKKSLTLNLKSDKGREILYKLVEKSDVFVHNYRVRVVTKLGVDYETLSRYNPKLVYAVASGYGPKGPEADSPCFDYVGTARSGLMMAYGESGSPLVYPAGGIADQGGAIMLAFAVVTALLARERLGIGQKVEISQVGSMVALQGLNVMASLLVHREMNKHDRKKATNPLWNHYLCQDGKWLCLACFQSDRYWHDFCEVMGIQELENDPKFDNMVRRGENCEELVCILDKRFITKPRDEWLKLLKEGGDFIFTPVQSVSDLGNDPQILANDYITYLDHPELGRTKVLGFPITMDKTPGRMRLPAPKLGQHTEELLIELLGYSWEELSQLRDEGVI